MAETPGPQRLSEFPEQVSEDVRGLSWLGYLEDSFSEFGHHFSIRTLKGDEELAVGILTKEYRETMMEVKAFVWANTALTLTSVDHDDEFCEAVSTDPLENYRARFNWCLSNWHYPLAEEIYRRLEALLIRQQAAMAAMRDLSYRSQVSYSPSPDSSTEAADSERPEILDLVDED